MARAGSRCARVSSTKVCTSCRTNIHVIKFKMYHTCNLRPGDMAMRTRLVLTCRTLAGGNLNFSGSPLME